MSRKQSAIQNFFYDLPDKLIAKYPLAHRDESKLLIYKKGEITEDVFMNVDTHFSKKTLLIFNDTKVVNARLLFKKDTGSTIELFCLEPDNQYCDITIAMMQKEKVVWKCLIGGAKKFKAPVIKTIKINNKEIQLTAKKLEKINDYYLVEFYWNDPAISFAEVLHYMGEIPLPPYLNRVAEQSDEERYQTVYAKINGSVAAPTAGLHFTPKTFSNLSEKNIEYDFITLHVGAATFKPLKSNILQEHEIHSENIEVEKKFIENLLLHLKNDIITVGTTSLRTVESLYWLGVKTFLNNNIIEGDLQLFQNEIDELGKKDIPVYEALTSLLQWMQKYDYKKLFTKTQIFIRPGYKFKIIKALITNFHQPESSLLLLIAAIAGEDWKRIYEYALEKNFRFLSYGDSSLLWKQED